MMAIGSDTDAIRQLFDRYQMIPEDAGPNWNPTPENWIQLTLILAHRHGEPGFELDIPKPDPRYERTWNQDLLVEHFLATGEAKSTAAAARLAAARIDKGLRSGRYGTDPVITSVEVGSIKSGYSARTTARGQRESDAGQLEATKLPPSLEAFRAIDEQMRSRFASALRITSWPEPRFYSADEITRVMAMASERQVLVEKER
jgi:hypothetical protein